MLKTVHFYEIYRNACKIVCSTQYQALACANKRKKKNRPVSIYFACAHMHRFTLIRRAPVVVGETSRELAAGRAEVDFGSPSRAIPAVFVHLGPSHTRRNPLNRSQGKRSESTSHQFFAPAGTVVSNPELIDVYDRKEDLSLQYVPGPTLERVRMKAGQGYGQATDTKDALTCFRSKIALRRAKKRSFPRRQKRSFVDDDACSLQPHSPRKRQCNCVGPESLLRHQFIAKSGLQQYQEPRCCGSGRADELTTYSAVDGIFCPSSSVWVCGNGLA